MVGCQTLIQVLRLQPPVKCLPVMALSQPNLRTGIRSAMSIGLIIVSLLGSVAFGECGGHLKSFSSDHGFGHSVTASEETSKAQPIRSGLFALDYGKGLTPKALPAKPSKSKQVCWSCRGAVQTDIAPSIESHQELVLSTSSTNSPISLFGFELPQDSVEKASCHFSSLLRPPIV